MSTNVDVKDVRPSMVDRDAETEKLIDEQINKRWKDIEKAMQTGSPILETSSKIAKMMNEIKKRRMGEVSGTDVGPQPLVAPVVTMPSGIASHVHEQHPQQAPPIVNSPPQISQIAGVPSGEKGKIIEEGPKCTTCHTGHLHELVRDINGQKAYDGVSYKCTGPDCGKEYVMIPKDADYKCVNCSAPIKRPTDDTIKFEKCPFCGSKKAVKFDWQRLWRNAALGKRV